MTPSSDQSPLNQLNFGKLNGRQVIANFEGGKITSDAGIILMAELDQKLKITARFAECFRDYRNSSYLDYSVHQLLAQRVYGIVLGYEDVNDHDKLRHDPALAIALKKLNFIDSAQANLAGKSTINRLEYCPETVINQENSRYHKIEPNPKEIEKAFVDIFLESYKKPPKQIILDMDVIREKWSDTQILVRGDSAYSREDIMKFCESQAGVDYVLAMATNSQLKLRATDVIEKAKADYEQRLQPVTELMETLFSPDEELGELAKLVPESTWYRSLCYQTQKSWSRSRRVVTKVCPGSEGVKIRHVVTSLPASKIPPSKLYTEKYCPRGEMENRIKEQQLELFADRTSTQTFESNQLRLWLSSMAYVLMQAFRQNCLAKTSFAKATVGTIRLNFLKLGARITVSVRRILIAIASSCPYQDILAIAYSRIQAIAGTG